MAKSPTTKALKKKKKPTSAVKNKTGIKKKVRPAVAKVPVEARHTGGLWNLLEKKQKALEQNPKKHPFAHSEQANGTSSHVSQKGFGRFNGPRRRAA